MEVAQQFGINWLLLAAQTVNFLIVIYVLKRIMYKPIQEMLKKRQETITLGLKQAEEARLLLANTEKKESEVLKKAQQEAKQMLVETKTLSAEMLVQAEAATKKQTEALLKEARAQISFETAEAEKRLSTHISQLAVTFLQKSITDLFSESDQELIMKNAMKKLQEKAN